MRFTMKDVFPPDPKHDLKDYWLVLDLRYQFPKLESNHEITDELKRRGVVGEDVKTDEEYSGAYFYFETEKIARAFLARLNAQPEVKNYKKPDPLPKELVAFSVQDWRKIRKFLKDELLTEKQWNKLKAGPLKDIGMYEIVCHKNGLGEPFLEFKIDSST